MDEVESGSITGPAQIPPAPDVDTVLIPEDHSDHLRRDQVASGVSFLKHPNVKSTPLSQRLAFLEQKGLTPAEISAAPETLLPFSNVESHR